MAARRFTIDDAFEESEEDKIRLYNYDSSPLQLILAEEEEEEETSGVESPGAGDVFVKQPKSIIKNPILLNPTLRGLKSREDNTSLDSNSLIQGQPNGYYGGQDQDDEFWWKHPKIKQNLKMVVAAIVLVILGALLILTGIIIYCLPSLEDIKGFIFLIAGIICVLPGGYHLIYIYLAVKGKRGFDFHHLPLFS